MNLGFLITRIIVTIIGFAGGGGSDSGGGSFDSGGGSFDFGDSDGGGSAEWWMLPLEIVSIVIMILIYLAVEKIKTDIVKKRIKRKHEKYSDHDWKVLEQAEEIFAKYQRDWSDFNTANIKEYTTEHYYNHAVLMLDVLKSMHRQNKVPSFAIIKYDFVNMNPAHNPEYRVHFTFSGQDVLIDADARAIFSKSATVEETWNFIEDEKGKLRLARIDQPTISAPHLLKKLQNFAEENHMYYSPDWGRMGLPMDGLIFDQNSVLTSDVNNHIVGKWDDILVQIYSYKKVPGIPESYFLVGQLTVPKSYDGIIFRHRKDKYMSIPQNYHKYEMEWNDFNRRYEVYATDTNTLEAFELLNPKFMADLYDRGLKLNLQVIGNNIYFFTNAKKSDEKKYAAMMDTLIAAYHELKK